MSTFKYNLDTNTLKEQPTIPEPLMKNYDMTNDYNDWFCDCENYKKHIAALRSYPCSESAKEVWKDGQELAEKDFFIENECELNPGCYCIMEGKEERLCKRYNAIAIPFFTPDKPETVEGVHSLAEKIETENAVITFGLTADNIKVIEKWIAHFNNHLYNYYAWREIGKEISWEPLTAMCYYLNWQRQQPLQDQDEMWNKVVAKVATADICKNVTPGDNEKLIDWKEKVISQLKELFIITPKEGV